MGIQVCAMEMEKRKKEGRTAMDAIMKKTHLFPKASAHGDILFDDLPSSEFLWSSLLSADAVGDQEMTDANASNEVTHPQFSLLGAGVAICCPWTFSNVGGTPLRVLVTESFYNSNRANHLLLHVGFHHKQVSNVSHRNGPLQMRSNGTMELWN